MDALKEIIKHAPDDLEILNAWLVTDERLNNCHKALCSVSGGSDSDIVTHLCATLDKEQKVTYVFFDTGLEYQATKDQIAYLKQKYGIEIITARAEKPIPLCCKQYGVPFLSKLVSDYISRLQKHNFQWEDRPYEELTEKYPRCSAALRWWCNAWGEGSRFNISHNPWLKEFMVQNPPQIKICSKCCHYTKKVVAKKYIEAGGFDLNITGVRKAEGGLRATAYKGCYTPGTEKTAAHFRPLFWFRQDTKRLYETHYDIRHSACYETWGLKRTGCAGCPFAKNFEAELLAIEKYEPKLCKALQKVFGASYEYTRKYRAFQKEMNAYQKNVRKRGAVAGTACKDLLSQVGREDV